MLYLVHEYKKKFESTNMDLTHSKIMIFLAFLVRGYGCSISHKIMPYTTSCKFRPFLVTHSLAYKNKELFKTVYEICSGSIYMKGMKIKQNSVNFQN